MARFDLYEDRKYWWFSIFMILAGSKNDPDLHQDLVDLIIEATDKHDTVPKGKKVMFSYYVKDGTK